jgi:hypothetical protein
MAGVVKLNELILDNIQELSEKEKKEILSFIEYLKIKEDHSFIEYVNKRTQVEAKRRGEEFTSLEDLQRDYA